MIIDIWFWTIIWVCNCLGYISIDYYIKRKISILTLFLSVFGIITFPVTLIIVIPFELFMLGSKLDDVILYQKVSG